MITPDYFQTFGIRLVRGRTFTDQDNASSVKVAVVNESFVNKFFKDKDPLQQRVSVYQVGAKSRLRAQKTRSRRCGWQSRQVVVGRRTARLKFRIYSREPPLSI